jgi:ubiquinone/menaquinone biosynthesis C-methylase UbiE
MDKTIWKIPDENYIFFPETKNRQTFNSDTDMDLFKKMICIDCGGGLLAASISKTIDCDSCGKKYAYRGNVIDFMRFELDPESGWNTETFDKGYSILTAVEDPFQNASRNRIPYFIEEYRMEKVKKSLAEYIAENKNATLLDIGCGTGWFDFYLRDKYSFDGEITGIDISQHNLNLLALEIKKRGDKKTSVFLANGEKMPFADKIFDIALMTESLEHVAEPETVIKEAARVLKRGGRFIITSPSGPICFFWNAFFFLPKQLKRFFARNKNGKLPGQAYDKPLSWRKIRQMLLNSGFSVSSYHKVIFLPHESYLQFFPIFVLRIWLHFAFLLERMGKLTNFMGLHHIVIAEKE